MKKLFTILLTSIIMCSCTTSGEVSSSTISSSSSSESSISTSQANADFDEATFENESVIYDGQPHILKEVQGAPNGTNIVYEGREAFKDVGSYEATATLSKEGYNDKTLSATLTISPASFSNITFTNQIIDYDGKEHSLTCKNVPSFATVIYENNAGTNVGEYHARATISADNYNTLVLEATLTIRTADIEGITFSDTSFTYDGSEHELTIKGNLPEGVNVEYTNNKRIDAGSQISTATISGYGYNTLNLSATLTVNPATFTGITFDDLTVTYDGEYHSVYCEGVPSFATVEYENNDQVNVGTYVVKATISAPNYETLVLKSLLVIQSRIITGVTFSDATFEYDGNEHEILVQGTIPEGVEVSYTNNKRTSKGTQEAKAILSGTGYKTLILKANLTIQGKQITGVTFNDATFDYDGQEHSIEVEGVIPEGVSVTYTENVRSVTGTQTATATLSGDDYETLVLTAKLSIIDTFNLEDEIKFSNENKFFEGTGLTYQSGTSTIYTECGRPVDFSYSNVGGGTNDSWQVLAVGGYFYNTTPINCFNDLDFIFENGYEHFKVYYSYDGTFTEAQSKEYTASYSGFRSTDVVYDNHPLYFKVVNIDEEPIYIEEVYVYLDLAMTNPYLTVTSQDTSKGTVSSGSYMMPGKDVSVTASAKSGYKFDAWLVDDQIVSIKETYTFKMPNEDYSIEARFITTSEYQWNFAHGVRPILDVENKLLTYGMYPQTHVLSYTTVNKLNALEAPEFGDWYYLEGEYYVKVVATPHDFEQGDAMFNDGEVIVPGETYWFKCEPIQWKTIYDSWKKTYYALSTLLLDCKMFYHDLKDRVIDDKNVYPNNYQYSDIREFLNGEFLEKAFHFDSTFVLTSTVYNGKSTTAEGTHPYTCDTTYDKVFLPSIKECVNYMLGEKARQAFTTDYSRAIGSVYMNTNDEEEGYVYFTGNYWTRSPDDTTFGHLRYSVTDIRPTGYIWHSYANDDDLSVRPAITFQLT